MRRRKFLSGSPNHIYQRSQNGSVIFYSLEDCLVYFTVFCTCAKRYGVTVLGLCEMYDHIHQLVEAPDLPTLSGFERMVNMTFSYEYYGDLKRGAEGFVSDRNITSGSVSVTIPNIGHLFQSPFGSAPKIGNKKIRTSIAYLYNNPVERNIHQEAIKWRWNFLAYSDSDHPYSEKVNLGIASRRLRRAVAKVKYLHATERPLTYEVLDNLFDSLAIKEKQQLVDLIINEYAIVDFRLAISFYGDYDKMLIAFASNTGCEYEISEPFDPHSGQAYRKMADYLARDNRFKSIGEVINLPLGKLVEYLDELVSQCGVRQCHAMKFLHIIQNRLGT